MRRRTLAIAASFLGAAATTEAHAQDAIAAARVANAAFDAALTARDLAAVEALRAQESNVLCVHPRDRAPLVGWEVVRRSFVEVFARFSELSVVMPEPRILVTGDVAVVVGLEHIRGRVAANGNPVAFDAMTTNVFERRGGRWLMVHHHATMMPA